MKKPKINDVNKKVKKMGAAREYFLNIGNVFYSFSMVFTSKVLISSHLD